MAIGVGETFRSDVAQGLPRKSAGKPEPGIRASSYGQRIALFGARGGLLSPEGPWVLERIPFFNAAEEHISYSTQVSRAAGSVQRRVVKHCQL